MRASSSRIGASQPTCANVGSSPIATDPPAMSRMVRIMAGFRPRVSANRPSRTPPSGRKKKASA
ncbi:hypothetical protein DV20_07655 [Amycolatopsis rifamycinica]|uniref:Uncharacterized protein n=1 Tax=Amycolatopsis rifamycinica TaxID=287986 RepID=A0A066U725_9PSEU|nr:hypothetical protein DV20_07655 [Amycolatopsis rifamycinica]